MPEIHPPGIYFGMDEDEYHADPSFSSSGIRDILVSPLTYWARHIDPKREDDQTQPMENGKAFHKRIVEGAEAFHSTYVADVLREDYPDALDTAEHIRDELRMRGLKVSGNKSALINRLLAEDPEIEIWERIEEGHHLANAGKTIIKPSMFESIQASARIIESHVSARSAFSGGYPEVSMFWIDQDTGVRMKARVDYLKTKAVVDLKTFTNPFDKPIPQAVSSAVANGKYHIQATLYSEGTETIKAMLRSEPRKFLHGEPDGEWLLNFVECPAHAFVFVFIEQSRIPNVAVKEFRRLTNGAREGAQPNLYWQSGYQSIRRAIEIYLECREKFGDEPWVDETPITPFTDENFPLWMVE